MTPQLRVARILWFALFFSSCVYLVVAHLVERPQAPAEPILLPVLGVTGLFMGVFSIVGTKVILQAGLRRASFKVTDAADRNAERMFREAPPVTRVFADPKATMQRAWAAYQTAFILGMAVAESIALLGLVLMFVGFSLPATLGFFVVCWGLMAFHFPHEVRLRKALESTYNASLSSNEVEP